MNKTIRRKDKIKCPHCGKYHTVWGNEEEVIGEGVLGKDDLLFYECEEDWYLAGIRGELVGDLEKGGKDE